MYVSNPWNSDFSDLPFYGDQSLISGLKIYGVNDHIVERFHNGSIVDIYKNRM